MTLQERAFMINLIKKNYYRRMTYFVLGITLIILSLIAGIVGEIIELETMDTIFWIFLSCVGVCGLVFSITPIALENKFPWTIKKAQADTLNQLTKVDFEDLVCHVPLKEYFEI